MRYLVISDVHGNLEALRTVMANIPPCDRLVCLGDLVGYGADPEAVVTTIVQAGEVAIVRGNHDKVCAALDDGHNFNENAYRSALWTRHQLSPANLAFLGGLPQGPLRVDPLVTISHGSPMDEDHYIIYEHDAYESFLHFDTPICFFGHSHVPGLFMLEPALNAFYYIIPRGPFRIRLPLDGSRRYLINPGSVGQPRDYDPRAACCVLDTATGILEFARMAYPTEASAARIREEGLPDFLAERLLCGV